MPPIAAAFFSEQDEAEFGVEVVGAQPEGAFAAAGGFDVESQDEAVEFAVVSGDGGNQADLGPVSRRDCAPE